MFFSLMCFIVTTKVWVGILYIILFAFIFLMYMGSFILNIILFFLDIYPHQSYRSTSFFHCFTAITSQLQIPNKLTTTVYEIIILCWDTTRNIKAIMSEFCLFQSKQNFMPLEQRNSMVNFVFFPFLFIILVS